MGDRLQPVETPDTTDPDKNDKTLSKTSLASRILARKSGDVKEQVKTTAEVRVTKPSAMFKPPSSYPTVGMASHQPEIHATPPGTTQQDSVSNVALVALFAFEGLRRIVRRRRAKR